MHQELMDGLQFTALLEMDILRYMLSKIDDYDYESKYSR